MTLEEFSANPGARTTHVLFVHPDDDRSKLIVVDNARLAEICATSPKYATILEQVAALRAKGGTVACVVVFTTKGFTVASIELPPN